ncbi:MAG: c-type cytochrome biogenesis protein CcmI [Thalassobaculaceae bacterium]
MLFWGIAGLLTLICVILVIWPLLRQQEVLETNVDYNLKVYTDQLSEVDKDFQLGRVDSKELDAIKTEIQRRILTENVEANQQKQSKQLTPTTYVIFTLIASFLIPSAAIGIYANFGSPGNPDVPLSKRADLPTPKTVEKTTSEEKKPNEQHAGIDNMITNLQEKLKVNPKDLQNWELLGRKQYEAASNSLRQAVSIFPSSLELRATYAEALVLAAQGRISREALKQFKLVSKSIPEDPRVRYYLGLADYQQKKIELALQKWTTLLDETPQNAPWRKMLTSRIDQATKDLGIKTSKPTQKLASKQKSTASSVNAAKPSILKEGFQGPTSEDIRAAQTLSKNDRQEMINNMVEGLAAKLKNNPDDLDGWLRLSRSYKVLGKLEKSKQALKRAANLAPTRIDLQLELARVLLPEGSPNANATAEFKVVVERIRREAPEHPEALYFAGLLAKAEGDNSSARKLWGKLLEKMGPNAPARSMIKNQLKDLE